MKHAREDYNRIQDPANKIPMDEPVFLIRAQDVCAPQVVAYWCEQAKSAGADPSIINAAKAQVKVMIDWQMTHRNKVKIPDLPKPRTASCSCEAMCMD